MTDTVRNFVTGKGMFVADLVLPDMLHLKVVRSIYGRARILGVKGGITGADLKATLASVGEGAEGGAGVVSYPVLAQDRVNYVGQPIAGVLGETEAEAEDRTASIDVEYEPLQPIVDPEKALHGEPIHPGTTSNVFGEGKVGKKFRDPSAPLVLEDTLENERVIPNPLETRGVVAHWNGSLLTVYAGTQSAHSWQDGLAESLTLPKASVRVVQMDTGGAFGSKGGIYPEHVLAGFAAIKEKRPVRWIETRTEHLQATEQGRGSRARMRMFADRKGKVLGLKADILTDGGAYSAGMGEFTPRWIALQVSGAYAIPKVYVEGRAVFTNKVPLGPYRGAGRPEAAFFMERMMDALADETGLDPVDVRLRNVRATTWTSPTGVTVPPARRFLQAAVRELGYRKQASRRNVGFSFFLLLPAASMGESARIAVQDGRLKVWLGGNVHGQGHETWVRSLVRQELAVPVEVIDLMKGDTRALSKGVGAWGSRSAIVGGGAVVEASRKLKAQVRKDHGKYSAAKLLAGPYDAQTFFRPKGNFNSLGANLVVADLEDTGLVRVRECLAYYDAGTVLNPPMVESQIVGGSVQGIGQVLFEAAPYDQRGQPLAASLADVGLSTAVEIPRFRVMTARTKSTAPHGSKGIGESPTIGVPPALIRAIERQAGKRLTKTPLRPEDLLAPTSAAQVSDP